MRRTVFLICVLCAAAALASNPGRTFSPRGAWTAAAQGATVATVPLYRLVHERGFHLYTTDAHERDVSIKYNGYRDEGVVAHVLPKRAHRTVTLYRLSAPALACKGTHKTAKFFYTTDEAARDKAVAAGWHLDGVVGFVAPPDAGLPGTVPFHRMYNDLSPCNKVLSRAAREREFASVANYDDDHFYTASEAEKDQAVHQGGYVSQGIACYVWPAPASVALHAPAAPLPDLAVPKVFAEDTSVKGIVQNQGKRSVSSTPGVLVRFVVSDRAGKVVLQSEQKLGGMSPGQSYPVVFDTTKLASKVGLNYRITVDPANAVPEADDSNNSAGDVWGIKIKADPKAAERVPAPEFVVTDIQVSAGAPITHYKLNVRNWGAYKPEWFQSLKGVLPAAKCGQVNVDARMLVHVSTDPAGGLLNNCLPLAAGQDLTRLGFNSAFPLAQSTRIRVTLEDRLTGAKYASEPYAVGWFGLDKVLVPAGCKYLLGRAGSYVCTTDQGMAACENLRQKGKPIRCARAGKGQD